MKTNATRAELEQALMSVNDRYDWNLAFRRLDSNGKHSFFTLGVHDSTGKGSRLAPSRRRTSSACWHVHGHFFDALFEIKEDAFVVSGWIGKITKEEGNWEEIYWDTHTPLSILCNC